MALRLPLSLSAVLSMFALATPISSGTPEAQHESNQRRVRAVSWIEAKPLVERLADAAPAGLRRIPEAERPDRWSEWISTVRHRTGARLAQGDDDSLVNLLLFGTSFTAQPRITSALLADLDRRWSAGDPAARETLMLAYRGRVDDLIAAMRKPGASGRMRYARAQIERRGHDLATDEGRRAAGDDLLASVVRVRQEAANLSVALEAARQLPDSAAAFAERSRIFRERGLAPDSSVLTQFAVDRALCALRERGALPVRGVSRVAIVGPGLDFADKQEGFDFYEPQSLQPFTAVDSLLRCGLAADSGVRATTLDVSTRVNDHLCEATDAARRQRRSYRLVLPWDTGARWSEEAIRYWQRVGDQIGTPFDVAVAGSLPGVRARGVAVRPDVVDRLQVTRANIVVDRMDLAAGERFDLVIATNVLVYYDRFEQTLAAAAMAAMLKPGGLLLANDALLEIPEVPLRSVGYLTVPFSDRPGDGEHMVWYLRPGGEQASAQSSGDVIR